MSIQYLALAKNNHVYRDVATSFRYPGGDLHLKDVADPPTGVVWIADVRGADPDDLFYAALLADIAERRDEPFVLFLPYLPAARADKDVPRGVKVYADQINAIKAHQVIGIDAHSGVINRHLNNLTELGLVPLVKKALGYKNGPQSDFDDVEHWYDAIICPDEGALGRAARVAEELGPFGVDVYHAVKQRDQETGRILCLEMVQKPPAKGSYLVVDDICDGGGTFQLVADATGIPQEQLGLWVTHGIFSGKANLLRRFYGKIFTTDSHPGHDCADVATSVTPVEAYMLQNVKDFG